MPFVLVLVFMAIGQALKEAKHNKRIAQGLPPEPQPKGINMANLLDGFLDGPYQFGAVICGILSGLVAWIIIGSSYGMWGVLLGWIPAALIGLIAGFLWPVAAVAAVIGIIAYLHH
jgi:hypothetical protein